MVRWLALVQTFKLTFSICTHAHECGMMAGVRVDDDVRLRG
jgi:hypothetical protein